MVTADKIKSLLNLKPHPVEGGYFAETYRSQQHIPKDELPDTYDSDRPLATAIYYLLTPDTFSTMHRLPADEIFHFYLGDPVEMLQLLPDGSGSAITLGPDILNGMHLQVTVGKGVWQGSRLLPGGKFALLGTTIGALIGVVSAYFGARADMLIQRLMDGLLAIPILLMALVIIAVMGNTIPNLIIAIAVPMIPRASRVVRSSALSVKAAPYIEAARSLAASNLRIIFLHIIPNVMASYLIVSTSAVGQAILIDAALGFLGFGSTEPTPSWGVMLSGSASLYAIRAPWMVISPGACITLAVFSFNLLGDSLRDALDPKLSFGRPATGR